MADPLHRWTALGLASDLADGKRIVLVLAFTEIAPCVMWRGGEIVDQLPRSR